MKPFRITKKVDPGILEAALVAAGVPLTESVFSEKHGGNVTRHGGLRCGYDSVKDARDGNPAMYAVLLVPDAAVDATVNTVIAAHAPAKTPSRSVSTGDRDRALAAMEKI